MEVRSVMFLSCLRKMIKGSLAVCLAFCMFFNTGCSRNGEPSESAEPSQAPVPTERVPVYEEIPEHFYVDTGRLRRNNLTEEWTVNESHILNGFYNLYNPEIVKVEGEEYPYKMWIFGESTTTHEYTGYDSIFYGRGKNLNTWEMYCGEENGEIKWDATMNVSLWEPIMVHADQSYDSVHNGDPSVVYKDGRYYMAFSSVGFDNRAGITYIINCIMGAVSDDGIHWEKSQAPILIWDKEYEEGWVAGEANPPSVGGYHRPSLMYDEQEQIWKMWFDYYLPGTFLSMGYAVNNGDFMNPADWKEIHAGEDPQLKDWPNPDVIQINGTYYAFSDCPKFGTGQGPQNDRRIVMATSPNGWDWTVEGYIMPEDRKYGTHLPQAFTETVDGKTYLYIFYSLTTQDTLPKYSAANYVWKILE